MNTTPDHYKKIDHSEETIPGGWGSERFRYWRIFGWNFWRVEGSADDFRYHIGRLTLWKRKRQAWLKRPKNYK
jgi:hypothetical protein